MVCYTIPLAAAILMSLIWGTGRRGPASWWLNLMLYGGAIFGIVDHMWAGELLFLGKSPILDLLLGVTITGAIFGGWGIIFVAAKAYPELGFRMGFLKPGKRA